MTAFKITVVSLLLAAAVSIVNIAVNQAAHFLFGQGAASCFPAVQPFFLIAFLGSFLYQLQRTNQQ